ncbi:MAG: molybdopterin dinucleotide binding domain-containing protein, partial [Acidimicrobiales bacterium]
FDSPESIRAELARVAPGFHPTDEQLAAAGADGVLVRSGDVTAPGAAEVTPPVNDAYSLRLVAGRRMYDDGVMLRHCPSSRGLARPIEVRLNPADFDPLGVDPGTPVTVTSGCGRLEAAAHPDVGVPRGSAAMPWAAPGAPLNALIDHGSPVTDVRVEL